MKAKLLNIVLISAVITKVGQRKTFIELKVKDANKKVHKRKISWDKSEDYWDAIEVNKEIYDVNIWINELASGKEVLRATIYPTEQVGSFLQTITSVFSSRNVK